MSEREEKDLVKRRASYKGRLTAFSNYLNELQGSLNALQVTELRLRLGKIENLYLQYDDVQTKLECLVSDMDLQLGERSEFETLYYQILSKAQDLLARNTSPSDAPPGSEKGSRSRPIKLPVIVLKKFSGYYDNWLEFRDTYTSLIHSNEEIDDINKFHYLRASLEGAAAVVIQSIEFSAINYSIAWKLLCDRFDNRRLLIQNHVNALFNLDTIKSESSASLKRLIDQFNKNLRALESLQEPTKHWDTLLIHIVTLKIDQKTFREWEECKSRLDKNLRIELIYFLEFLRSQADLLETLEMSRGNKAPQHVNSNIKLKAMVSVANSQPESQATNRQVPNVKSCSSCSGSHMLYECPEFLALSNEKRLELLPKLKICFNCFKPGHYANHCKKAGCKICKRRHNTLVHVAEFKKTFTQTSDQCGPSTPASTSPGPVPTSVALTSCIHSSLDTEQDVLLSTALVNVLDRDGRAHVIRVLLDCASSSCIITEKLSTLLNLPLVDVNKSIYGINNTQTHTSKICRIELQSLSENYCKELLCYILPAITDKIPCRRLNICKLNIPTDIKLADPSFYKPSNVDMVIGSNVFWDLLGSQKINLGDNEPILWETRLGWLVSGPISQCQSSPILCNLTKIDSVVNHTQVDDSQHILSRFWQIEEVDHIDHHSTFSKEEQLCEDHFKEHVSRLTDGKFCVKIPLKQSPAVLGDSLARAKHCLLGLERKFKSDPDFQKMYVDFMSEYISLGHMTQCSFNTTPTAYFIPHHGIIRESSTTTKLRVVFNASMPTTSQISCNNIQLVGPTVQDDLLSILIRFRQHKYVLAADVENMYRQVMVHPADRYLQQIVWRDDASEPIKCYQLNTVTYGTASAPFLATRCLKQIGLECDDKQIAEIIIHDMYVDDLLTGTNTLSEALTIKNKISDILLAAGMPLRKWKSNNFELISPHYSASTSQITTNSKSVDLNIGNEHNKTLGLGWLTHTDELYFDVRECKFSANMTKRGILSAVGKIFDPLGLLSPCIILIKILLQKLWLLKLSWDDQLPNEIIKVWSNYLRDLPSVSALRIPRCVTCDSFNRVDLHIFSDASISAYGACIYVKTINSEGLVLVRLLAAKSRVAPIKPMTVPRLELCGALVGVRLYQKVISSIRAEVREVVFWTDSTIVLGWLKMHPNKLQPFVRNRIGEIVDVTNDCDWRHVPTDQNPADYITRGVNMNDIQSLDQWWLGPSYLSSHKSHWPTHPTIPKAEALPECREITLHVSSSRPDGGLIDFNRFSSLTRLKRTVAYVLRFINKCRGQSPQSKLITCEELQRALVVIIKLSQIDSFTEYEQLVNHKSISQKSSLCKFNVFLDDNKLMRVGGRLGNSSFSYDKKHPIIIQSTHRFTKLLFKYEHIRLMHAGPQLLLATVRESYWPIGGRNLAKHTYYQCVRCTRMKGRVLEPIMGNLPQSRLNSGGYPFECVGVDYAGPISSLSRQGRGSKVVKVYIALFVCFTTKAIHTELVGDLTSDNFMSALRRFISRRGKPRDLYSDNGTSFVGAYNEIGKFLKSHCGSLSEGATSEGINFHFIPPYSPHFGGLWESGVKSVKYHLGRVLGNCHLTYEELNTVLVQIEAILNSRPLSPLSSDPNDLLPLTPGHFLIGRPLVALPTADYQDSNENRLNRFQRIEKMRQHFWERWNKEYIGELQQRIKWTRNHDTLKLDSLVVIKEDNLPPLKWRLGRITAVHAGADGVSRVADIKTSSGVIRRSFSKICPLLHDEPSC